MAVATTATGQPPVLAYGTTVYELVEDVPGSAVLAPRYFAVPDVPGSVWVGDLV